MRSKSTSSRYCPTCPEEDPLSDQALRSKLIRLAHAKPELRPVLLPLLKQAASPLGPSVTRALKKGEWNLVVIFEVLGDSWSFQIVNPSGNITPSYGYDSYEEAVKGAGVFHGSFKDAAQIWLIYAILPPGGKSYRVKSTGYEKLPL